MQFTGFVDVGGANGASYRAYLFSGEFFVSHFAGWNVSRMPAAQFCSLVNIFVIEIPDQVAAELNKIELLRSILISNSGTKP
jgi:hypothetical protein